MVNVAEVARVMSEWPEMGCEELFKKADGHFPNITVGEFYDALRKCGECILTEPEEEKFEVLWWHLLTFPGDRATYLLRGYECQWMLAALNGPGAEAGETA